MSMKWEVFMAFLKLLLQNVLEPTEENTKFPRIASFSPRFKPTTLEREAGEPENLAVYYVNLLADFSKCMYLDPDLDCSPFVCHLPTEKESQVRIPPLKYQNLRSTEYCMDVMEYLYPSLFTLML
jgi:hypothetical protein